MQKGTKKISSSALPDDKWCKKIPSSVHAVLTLKNCKRGENSLQIQYIHSNEKIEVGILKNTNDKKVGTFAKWWKQCRSPNRKIMKLGFS